MANLVSKFGSADTVKSVFGTKSLYITSVFWHVDVCGCLCVVGVFLHIAWPPPPSQNLMKEPTQSVLRDCLYVQPRSCIENSKAWLKSPLRSLDAKYIVNAKYHYYELYCYYFIKCFR